MPFTFAAVIICNMCVISFRSPASEIRVYVTSIMTPIHVRPSEFQPRDRMWSVRLTSRQYPGPVQRRIWRVIKFPHVACVWQVDIKASLATRRRGGVSALVVIHCRPA